MTIINSQLLSIENVTDRYPQAVKKNSNTDSGKTRSFAEVLDDMASLKFSKHASGRLYERNIELSESQMTRLNAGMQAANKKGINESLVLLDDMAFIVNIKNQTVITAMDKNDTNGNVFTNIDGAVIA